MAAAKAYADQYNVEYLCFSSSQAASDPIGGNAKLAEQLGQDPRFRGWLTLSIHQPDASAELARKYLVKQVWAGAKLEQNSDADIVSSAGGREVLNALRRYSRPVVLTISSPVTLQAAIEAALEFSTVRFFLSPQSEYLTSVTVAAMKEAVNSAFLPVAAFTERDVIAHAVEVLGERRVVWGSDWGRFHPACALGIIRDSKLTGPLRERVGYRNAKDIMGQTL